MCWLPLGLGAIGGIIGGLAVYLAPRSWGVWALPFGVLCGAAVPATAIVLALRARIPAGRPSDERTPPPA